MEHSGDRLSVHGRLGASQRGTGDQEGREQAAFSAGRTQLRFGRPRRQLGPLRTPYSRLEEDIWLPSYTYGVLARLR